MTQILLAKNDGEKRWSARWPRHVLADQQKWEKVHGEWISSKLSNSKKKKE
jgi:hypothetical protein